MIDFDAAVSFSLELPEDRFFDPHPAWRRLALRLYESIKELPIISPHGHVDARLFSEDDYTFGSPVDLLIIPDHYVYRMLYSQGIPLEALGIKRIDGGPVEQDHRKIWQIFAENFYLFRGTPTGLWLTHELRSVFGIKEKLCADTAQRIYDQIADKLQSPDFRPRRLYEQFNIEVLCTTDSATDTLAHHQAIRASGWRGEIRPTFRPDALINLETPGWLDNIKALSEISGITVHSYSAYIQALEQRRDYFRSLGAVATDHTAQTAFTGLLSSREVEAIFQRALRGQSTAEDAFRFTGHMLIEMARMSVDDGLVMQLHVGALRNHNPLIYERFGADRGADIPLIGEFTRNLHPLLQLFGNDPRLTLILFTLDETTYSRELAPLAGHYPAVKLGPPWWFYDSLNGIRRYFDQVIETASLYNTCGFIDDTRAFLSIPARHDLWRRASANWLAGLVLSGVVDEPDAQQMAYDLAYRLARHAYKLENP